MPQQSCIWFAAAAYLCTPPASHSVTNEMETLRPEVAALVRVTTNNGWRSVVVNTFTESGSTVFFDRFGPSTHLRWLRHAEIHQGRITEKYSSEGENALATTGWYTARETVVATLCAREWDADWKSFAQKFFRGSIGNTVEEEIDYAELSYNAAEASWWQRATREKTLQYGVRIRTKPYGYFRVNIGHYSGLPILITETRIRYDPFKHERIEEYIRIPLSPRWRLGAQCVFSPTRFGSNDRDVFDISLGLEHTLGAQAFKGAFSVGTRFDTRGTSIVISYFNNF